MPDMHETESEIIFGSGDSGLVLRKPCWDAPRPDFAEPMDPSVYDRLRADPDDVLGNLVLSAGDPDYASVAAALPPLEDLTFVGAESVLERFEVRWDGRVVGVDEDPLPEGHRLLSASLLDGRLPVLCHLYETADGREERLTFCAPRDGHGVLWRRITTLPADRVPEVQHLCSGGDASPEAFYADLRSLCERWDRFFAGGMRCSLPEPDLWEAAQAMLALGVITFRGLSPRYGVGWYGEPQHGSFPPSTIFLLQSLLAHGHLDRAGDLLAHYVSRYVKEDGTFDYYGPAVAEYGQVLSLIAEYVRLTRQPEWLQRRLTLLRPVWQRLLALRQETLAAYLSDDPRHGLIPGLPEADYHGKAEQWQEFYYSGDAWTCRALLEIGRLLREQPATAAEGETLLAEAAAYSRDVLASLALVEDESTGYVPPGPGQTAPIDNLTADQHASYCNYRYLLEMLSAGILSPEQLRRVSDWRRHHGGELLAMTRFIDRLDDWPALHYARALLELDDADHYLLLMYAHWAHHCARGTWASYEQAAIAPDETGVRRMVAGQVVPCQVMMPTMLRWGLVYEERDSPRLWLCRAIPRRWLEPGQTVRVRRAPTAFGSVGFTIKVKDDRYATVNLRLRGEAVPEVYLRLRAPEDRKLKQVLCDECSVSVEGDVVKLCNVEGKIKLLVEWD